MLQKMRNTVGNIRSTNTQTTENGVQRHVTSVARFAVIAALALSVMAVPTSAAEAGATHESDVNADVQADAQASAKGLHGMLVSVQNRLTAVQEQLVSVEARLADLEATVSARGQQNAATDTGANTASDQESDASGDEQTDAESSATVAANADVNAGADVEHDVNTETDGAAQVEHRVEKDGETVVDFVINGLFGKSEQHLDIAVNGDVDAGNTVTVNVTDDDEPVVNATVRVNGEHVGETTADGQLTFEVPDRARLSIVVRDGDKGATAHYDVGTETESSIEMQGSAESSSSTRHSSSGDEDASTEEEQHNDAESDAQADSGSSGETDAGAESGSDSEANGSAEASASVSAGASATLS